MKSYMIVTNDKYELPVAGMFNGMDAAAEWLGLKTSTVRGWVYRGTPQKSPYKVEVVKERQIEDVEQYQRNYQREYSRKRRMYKGDNQIIHRAGIGCDAEQSQ